MLTSALKSGSSTDISGTLHSAPSTSYFVEYFDTSSCTGAPQGQAYLGFKTVTTDASGDASLGLTTSQVVSGDAVTATATSQATLDTSEFSNCAIVNAPDTFVVTKADEHDDGICDSDCTLREAINAANASGVALAHIDFAIPGGGPQQIAVTGSALPALTVPVVIDGTTEGAPPGQVGIVLNGAGAGAADGLVLAPGSGGSTIRGLAIRDFSQAKQAAIRIQSSGNTIVGDYIGTDATGTGASGNDFGIVVENSNDNVIGGTGAGDRNVIADNADEGVLVDGTASGADGNTVKGNYIGVDATGQTADGNQGPGVRVLDATNTLVGGPTPADGNVISANFIEVFLGDADVASNGKSNTVQNNLLGLSADQSVSFPDSSSNGVEVMDAGSNTLSQNMIAAQYQGVDICGSGSNIVSSNTIGTNSSLIPDFGVFNQGISILDTPCFTAGGSGGPATGNVVTANVVLNSSLNGIAADSNLNIVATNTVTNTKNGAAIESSGNANRIGPDNSVRNNAHDGVQSTAGTSDTITQNSINGNGGKGISLVNGANDGQTTPTLASATPIGNGSVRIQGTLTSNANRNSGRVLLLLVVRPLRQRRRRDLHRVLAGLDRRHGNAADRHGLRAFRARLPGSAVTATATDTTSGATSEFSTCVTVTDPAQTSPFIVNTNSDHEEDGCTAATARCARRSTLRTPRPAARSTSTCRAARRRSRRPRICRSIIGRDDDRRDHAARLCGHAARHARREQRLERRHRVQRHRRRETIRGFSITDWSRTGIASTSATGTRSPATTSASTSAGSARRTATGSCSTRTATTTRSAARARTTATSSPRTGTTGSSSRTARAARRTTTPSWGTTSA